MHGRSETQHILKLQHWIVGFRYIYLYEWSISGQNFPINQMDLGFYHSTQPTSMDN